MNDQHIDPGVDARISAALRAAAEQIDDRTLRHALPPLVATHRGQHHHIRWIAPILAAAAVIAVVLTMIAVTSGSTQAGRTVQPGGASSPQPSASPLPTSTSSPSAATSATPVLSMNVGLPTATCDVNQPCALVLPTPLWPFTNAEQAQVWQVKSQPQGIDLWHADAVRTAQYFTTKYLGFTDLTAAWPQRIGPDEALVNVGYLVPGGSRVAAAVLHLQRYGAAVGRNLAGWEVVGTEDTSLTIFSPAEGSTVRSPAIVAGSVDRVDESIVVVMRSQSGSVVGEGTPIAAGAGSPWEQRVYFKATGVMVVVVSTGGHTTAHDRFAIQVVHS